MRSKVLGSFWLNAKVENSFWAFITPVFLLYLELKKPSDLDTILRIKMSYFPNLTSTVFSCKKIPTTQIPTQVLHLSFYIYHTLSLFNFSKSFFSLSLPSPPHKNFPLSTQKETLFLYFFFFILTLFLLVLRWWTAETREHSCPSGWCHWNRIFIKFVDSKQVIVN